ncbi:MAG: hypothetical protein ACRCST_06175 [Turicibacter sp.]
MARNFLNKLFSREEQSTQSMLQPNSALDLENLSKYTQVFSTKEDTGFKGLKRAFENQLNVEITMKDEALGSVTVAGTISHYDEKYEQLLVIADAQLKRVVFDQIIDVNIEG